MHDDTLKSQFISHIQDAQYPCVMAKSALLKSNIHFVIGDVFCPAPMHVEKVLCDIYALMDSLQDKKEELYSIAVLFRTPQMVSEEEYEEVFWPYLQTLHRLDSRQYAWDPCVSSDPNSSNFSFSLKGEAFYVIGMHNKSSRKARTSLTPAMVFNPHRQFESLREKGNYDKIRDAIRARDVAYSGSQNPMLENFGTSPEVLQYTGRAIDKDHWVCPFKALTANA